MAAVAVISLCDDHRDNGYMRRKTQRLKTGLDDELAYISTEWRRRCTSSCIGRRDLAVEGKKASPRTSSEANIQRLRSADETKHPLKTVLSASLNTSLLTPIEPPPPYNDSIADALPSYDPTEKLATAQILHKPQDTPPSYPYIPQSTNYPPESMPKADIDFDDTSVFKQAAGKKGKKSAAAASKSKWADEGDEGGSKDGGEGGDENGGGVGGSNNGDGGAGGDGDGGGGGDWGGWDTGKKKKGKKGRKEQEEEEKNKKEEEEAANGGIKLDWADEANGDAGDDWGEFTNTTKKKDKKDKKGKVEDKPSGTSNFDDISLDDTPQIELSFGSTKDKKDTGFGSNFGGWNPSNWGTGNDWSFSGADAGTTDIADSFSKSTKDTADPATTDSGVWNFGGNKKGNKKKTTSSGFDFGDLGGLDEDKEEEEKKEEPKADDWGAGSISFGKKDKKSKKKSAWDDTPTNPNPDTIGTALADPEPVADNSWDTWGTTTTKKIKGKKGEGESEPPPPPPPPAAVEPPLDDFVGFGTKKTKKAGKKITEVVEDPIFAVVPEPEPEADIGGWGSFGKKDKRKGSKKESEKVEEVITALPEPEPEADAGGWGSFGKKEKKKAGKKEEKVDDPIFAVVGEPEAEIGGWGSFGKKDKNKAGKKEEKIDDPIIAVVDVPEAEIGGWGSLGKKDKKKAGKKDADKASEPDVTKVVEPEAKPDDDWGGFGAKTEKKKKKKSVFDEPEKEELIVEEKAEHEPGFEPEPAAETGWGAFGSKKKKAGKKDVLENKPPPPPDPEPVVEEKPALSSTGSKKDKKGKKGLISEVKEDPIVAVDSKSVADATSVAGEDDWGSNWGATDKKKDKKSKRNSIASSAGTKEDAALPPPPVPDVPNASSFDIWGSASKKDKDKKGKKGKAAEPETEFLPDQEPDVSKDFLDDDFGAGTWGLSAKDKKKKEKELEKKKQAKAEEEEKAKQEEEEKVSKEEDEWAASIMGLSVKERKKKERERDKAKKDKEEKEQRAKEDEEARQKEEEEERVRKEEEEKAAEEEAKTIKKGKLGKKGKTTTSPEVSKTKDLLADSVPDTDPLVDTDTWGSSWGVGQKDKKKGSQKAMDFKVPPAAPTPPTQGLTPDAEEDDPIVDWGDFGTTTNSKSKRDAKKGSKVEDSKASKKGAKDKIDEGIEDKKLPKEETPAKAAKSFWGGMGATTSSKPKTAKEDKKAKEADFEDEEEDLDEIIEILDNDPPRKKSSKDKIGSKLSKTATKESDKANKSSDAKKKGIADEADDAPAAKGKDGKSKGVDKKDQDDGPKEDTLVSSLWGSSSKKTSGKKADEVKKEIGKQDSANQKASLKKGAAWNEPEAAREESDDQPPNPQPATKTSKSAMSTTKSTKLSPVQQKIRDLEKKRQEAAGESPPPPPPPPPAADPEPSSKLDKKGAKLKDSASKTASSKTKDLSPVERKKGFKDSVPGSFPGMDDLDDLMEMDSPSLEKKENKKSTKSSIKESTKTSKTRETPESKRLPTPPPEPKEGKPVKKERARVSKSLWGAPVVKKEVKKETKTKDDADVSLPPKKEKVAAAGLSRSKSTRTTTKEKETARSDPKSSDYDKVEDKVEKPKKADSRPPKSRGSSFGGLFGGGPPKRTTPTRRNSAISGPKTASRRQSIDVGDSGLPSPPIDDAPVSGKAAKLMGTGAGKLDRKASTRGKQKVSGSDLKAVLKQSENAANNGGTAAPDPYAIDSDDMVMVNPVEDPILNAQPLKKGLKSKSKNDVGPEHASLTRDLPDRSRPKRDSKMEPTSSKRKSKAVNDFEDDVVMVDAGPSDGPDVADGPDDMQFITKPKGLQRSATSAKKPESKKGGLFGAFRKSRRASETNERPKSRAVVEDEEVAPRKRTVTGGDDSAKRPRRDDRRRSEKVSSRAAEGYVYDTAGDAGATEAEDADARREERRSKRVEKDRAAKEAQEEALKYEAERRTKRREAEKSKAKDERDRKARKEEEAEARRQEEKDSRRAAREARRAKEEEQANRELEDDILKPRTKRRDNDKEISSRPGRSDRRRSHMDKPIPSSQTPDEEEARRLRREERRVKPSRRKSTAAAPVEDYFDPRNGGNNPYSENDHTASWLKSQVSEPPEPPPVEPTILETLPDLRAGNGGEDLLAEENLRRSSHRKSKRSSRMYTDPVLEDQETKTRRREGRRGDADGRGIRSSDGSAEGERYGMSRRQSDLGGVKLGTGTKTFDGRTGQGKRASWFQKITGM